MRTFAPVLLLVLVATLSPALSHAQHDVPVWYVEYTVAIKTDFTAPTSTFGGATSTTWVFDRTFSASAKLDMRNEGALITQAQAMTMDPEKMKNMSQAEMMNYSQQMLEAMQYTANWMPGPVEVGEEPDAMLKLMRAASVPVQLRYEATTTGTDLVDETGRKYDYVETTSAAFSGEELYLGDQYKLEINTKSKKYWLVLPYAGQDFSPDLKRFNLDTVQKTRSAGETAWTEQRSTHDVAMDWLPVGFKLDVGDDASQWPVIEGSLDGSGKITGEKTFQAHWTEGSINVPATVTFRYTLAQTPPATAKK